MMEHRSICPSPAQWKLCASRNVAHSHSVILHSTYIASKSFEDHFMVVWHTVDTLKDLSHCCVLFFSLKKQGKNAASVCSFWSSPFPFLSAFSVLFYIIHFILMYLLIKFLNFGRCNGNSTTAKFRILSSTPDSVKQDELSAPLAHSNVTSAFLRGRCPSSSAFMLLYQTIPF